MKLNYKRTFLVGFAFFLICTFWNAYDTIIPLILTNKFDMPQGYSGIIMSLDNLLAVFLLPFFGTMSDKLSSKFGKRTPFIFIGTVLSAVLVVLLGEISVLWVFIAVLLVVLISMALFRSPAVALMPDITPKPLRSKGNAIINLMGTAGGIIALGLSVIFKTNTQGKTDFTAYLASVGGVMIISLLVFMLTVKENKWASEAEKINEEQGGITPAPTEEPAEKRRITPAERTSLILILMSVALWYIGYNAITSKYSVYATEVLAVPYNITLMVAQGVALIAFIPVGILASKIGRRRSILIGVGILAAAFFSASFITKGVNPVIMYLLFALAGIGWATINVNSFPMVVELAKGGDVGKYTGYYYTASMAAQIITPVFSGFLVQYLGWGIFFPYATLFVAFSFVTMFFVKHGDAKPEGKIGIESLAGGDD